MYMINIYLGVRKRGKRERKRRENENVECKKCKQREQTYHSVHKNIKIQLQKMNGLRNI